MILSLLVVSLSQGIRSPGGPVKLSPLPAADNSTWLLTFFVASLVCFIWSFLGIFRKAFLEKLERHPTAFRFGFVAYSVIFLAMSLTVIVSTTNMWPVVRPLGNRANNARDTSSWSC